jgi:aldehyde dehydrogenase (NAD+)
VAIGDGLVRHPGIDMVSFTGSARTAKRIMAACSERLARVHFELGGKSACILLDDAPLERALAASFASACTNAGQGCTALSRVLAPRRLLDEVLDVLRDNALSVGFGDPIVETTVVGPVITGAQRDRIEGAVAGARRQGARTVAGGQRPDFDRGYWVAPTVLADVTNDMAIATEETFGPVVSVIAYETLEEAVHIANDSRYGLAGAVWTDDEELGLRVARQVKTGTIGINHALSDPGLPFGGFKESGIGRKWGYEGLSAYTELQTISLAPSG